MTFEKAPEQLMSAAPIGNIPANLALTQNDVGSWTELKILKEFKVNSEQEKRLSSLAQLLTTD